MIVDPPGTQLSHVSSPAKFVEVLDLMCNIQVPADFLKATEVRPSAPAKSKASLAVLCTMCTVCTNVYNVYNLYNLNNDHPAPSPLPSPYICTEIL